MAEVLREAFAAFEARYTSEAFAATTPPADVLCGRLGEGPSWVAAWDGRVVGTVSALPQGAALYVRSMASRPGSRGRGVGAALLQAVEVHARTQGFARLTLTTTPFLHAAIRLYERHGFTRAPGLPGDLHGTPLIGMAKRLEEAPAEPA